ncbi:hypothetical protein NDU88_001228 [Pleurodeles waltl]|uniref:Uncharacterized protein n=1 Tax=Pleurodeles waltl TaxID=8319 RepID=A0AAV7MKE4_PLEWA|nr:hypothetical protein NDU88_001228 [Pleurodeles waltl]
MTAPRSNDRGGHSGFPAGLAGDRQKASCQPSGKAPSTRKPAPDGAGGVEGVQQGAHDTRYRHPVPDGENRQEQDGGKGVGIPMAALQAVLPWRIPWGSVKPVPHGSTASLLAVLLRHSALAVVNRQGQNHHQSLFQAQSTWYGVENLLRGPQKKRYVEKWCVRRFLPSTHGLASLFFTRGSRASFSGARTVSFCGSRRLPDVPGLLRGFLLVFRLRVVLRGCVSKFRSHGRRRVDFSSGGRAALSLRGRASKFRSSQRWREAGKKLRVTTLRMSGLTVVFNPDVTIPL